MQPFDRDDSIGKLHVAGSPKLEVQTACLAVVGLLLGLTSAMAQPGPTEHDSHHPVASQPAKPNDPPAGARPDASAGLSSTMGSEALPASAVMGSAATPASGAMAKPPSGMQEMMEGMMKMMGGMGGGMASAPATGQASPTTGQTPPAGMMGMMGGAEGCCGGGTRKEIYPTLMGLPALTPENRAEMRRLSEERVNEGALILQTAQERLANAVAVGDHDSAALALQQTRDGIGRIGSGVAVHKLLQEGIPPQAVASQWFKQEMNLNAPMVREDQRTILGILPFHLFTMALLIAFALAMIAMYFFKMRRTAALFGRIDPVAGGAPPGASPPLAGSPSPSPTVPPTGGAPPAGAAPPPSPPDSAPRLAVATPPIPASAPPASSPPDAVPPATAKWRGQLRVGSIIAETPSVKTFRLLPSVSDSLLPFTYTPGQFLNVAFSIGGARMNRSYSISSSPTRREYVDLTVKREPRGAVSRHIDDLLKVGNEIEAGGPVGRFTFTGTEAQSIVLVAGGVGITPMMSITRYLSERSWPGDIYFIYGCSTPAEFIFAKDIAELQRANPKLHVTVTMERPEGTDWQGPRGRLTKELLAQTVPDIASRRIHLCGPPVMMEAVKAMLAELKVPPEQVKTEDFGTAAPTPAADGTTAKPTTPATGPLVTFSKNNKSSRIHVNQTVLELSEELDIGIEFSCRVGTCGICKVKMISGEVEMAVEDALDADDKAKGMILACQAKPKGPVEVEA